MTCRKVWVNNDMHVHTCDKNRYPREGLQLPQRRSNLVIASWRWEWSKDSVDIIINKFMLLCCCQVNKFNVRYSTHQQAVQWLVSQEGDIELLIQHVPQPPGLIVCVSLPMQLAERISGLNFTVKGLSLRWISLVALPVLAFSFFQTSCHRKSRTLNWSMLVLLCLDCYLFLFSFSQDVCLKKEKDQKLGLSIRGGGKDSKGNPLDLNDEGIFISKVRRCALT